jgi:hypothetical protein
MPTEKVTRAEAIAKGLAYFWSPKPCKHGHVGFRRVKNYSCYQCDKQRNREWHADHQDEAREKQQRFLAANPGYHSDYRARKPEVGKAARKRHRAKFPKKHSEEVARYTKRHAKRINAGRRARRKRDLAWAIRCNMASRLSMAVNDALGEKSAPTMKLVGCTSKFLVDYLEKLFLPGMTRNNYGNKDGCWVVDHIRPCKSFNLADPAQQRECFHYKNLQPLWHLDNSSKGAKLNWKKGEADASSAPI